MAGSIDHLIPRLRELRERRGLTQEAFAEKAGFSYKYYQAIEAGRKRELRLSTLDRLAAAHGLECWQLLHPDLANLPPRTSKLQKTGRGKAKDR